MRKNYSDKFKEKRITVTLDSDFEDVFIGDGALGNIKVLSLPIQGTLFVDGNNNAIADGDEAVIANQNHPLMI